MIRELAADLGFDLEAVTLAERAAITQCATLLLQVEVAGDQLVGGASIDPDTTIRLTSEARRLLAGLRERKNAEPAPSPFSPMRARWAEDRRRKEEAAKKAEAEAKSKSAEIEEPRKEEAAAS